MLEDKLGLELRTGTRKRKNVFGTEYGRNTDRDGQGTVETST